MKAAIASILFGFLSTAVVAQSNYKEGSNSFAKYTLKGDVKELENAKKFIDATYKTKRDSSSSKNNILRAMIYSSLAYADSTRKIKGDKDHIDVTWDAVNRIKLKDRSHYQNELLYVNQNLIAAYIFKANKEIEKKEFEKAYNSFLSVEKLGSNSEDVIRNLAYLATEAGKTDESINYYKKLLHSPQSDTKIYIALAKAYKIKQNTQEQINILKEAREKFPKDQEILFLLVDVYAETKSYQSLAPLLQEAIAHDPKNIQLYYLGGFANENIGNLEEAKKYYQSVLNLDDNNYDANLALGLIFLNEFLKDKNSLEAQYSAQDYLLKANGIKPYALNTLKGLALFYEASEDLEQLDRVNKLLNQLSNN